MTFPLTLRLLTVAATSAIGLVPINAARTSVPPPVFCHGCVAHATMSPTGGDTGSIVNCNGARLRLVLTLDGVSSGNCIPAPPPIDCRSDGICKFATSLSYSSRGCNIVISANGHPLGTFPDTGGALTGVSGQTGVRTDVQCGDSARIEYDAYCSVCEFVNLVTDSVTMSCSNCPDT